MVDLMHFSELSTNLDISIEVELTCTHCLLIHLETHTSYMLYLKRKKMFQFNTEMGEVVNLI